MQVFGQRLSWLLAFVGFLFITLLATSPVAQGGTSGPKKRIAVLDFEVKAKDANKKIGTGISEMLIDALVNTGRYIVLERGELDEVLKEQNLGASGNVTTETAAKSGQLLGAQLLIKGVVTEFKEKESGGGIGAVLGGKIGIGVGKVSAHVAFTMRLIDTETGQVLDSYRAEKKVSKKGLAVGTKIGKTPIGAAFFKSASMEKAINEAIANSIQFLDDQTKEMPWQGRVVMVDEEGLVYINAGANSGINIGEEFEISHPGKALIDPETGLNLGSKTTKIGCVKIQTVEEKYSIGKVINGSGGQRKDIVKYSGGCAGGSYKLHTP